MLQKKILVILSLFLMLVLVFPNGVKSQPVASVTLQSSGVILQASPSEYAYIMSVSGSTYQMKDGTTGQILFQSTDSSRVFSNIVGNCSDGAKVLVEGGTYLVTSSWTMSDVNGVTLDFAGARLVAANNLNTPVLIVLNVDSSVINDVEIDGNAENQQVIAGIGPVGILIIDSTNSYVDGANIYNARVYGFYSYQAYGGVTANNGIINSLVTNCGWNGITLGWDGRETGLYAINNEVAYASDVGISAQGRNNIVQDNYVHDINGNTGTNNARWGIATEAGSGHLISGNTITNVNMGLVSTAPSNTFTGNSVTGSSVFGVQIEGAGTANVVSGNTISNYGYRGVQIYGANSRIENNQISSTDTSSWRSAVEIMGSGIILSGNTLMNGANTTTIVNSAFSVNSGVSNTVIENNQVLGGFYYGVYVNSGASGTIIRNNQFTGCTKNINDLGSGTQIS